MEWAYSTPPDSHGGDKRKTELKRSNNNSPKIHKVSPEDIKVKLGYIIVRSKA